MITRSSRGRPISRRRLLKVSLSAAGAYSLQGARHMARAAGAVKQVTLTLDWVFQGPNVGFMLAQDNGFYRDVGLDVAITPGKGSVSTAQLIASKASQFGFFDATRQQWWCSRTQGSMNPKISRARA
jgi:NitT/TauT family transport system substrate-binding protein